MLARCLSCLLLSQILLFASCVSAPPPARESSAAKNYARNRAMDARDVVGATLVGGLPVAGLKVYAGPLGLGFFYAPESAAHGLIHGGELGLKHGEFGHNSLEDNTLLITTHEASAGPGRGQLRGKDFEGVWNNNPASYTRLGVAGACLLGFRLELNPGELLDLILGVFTLDIFEDDVYGDSHDTTEESGETAHTKHQNLK